MDPLLQTFWFIALPASLVFIIQAVMTFMGVDAHDGGSADFNSDLSTDLHAPFQLFSLRNLVDFMLGFSWTGVSFYDLIQNRTLLILLAIGVGLLFVFVFFVIMRQLLKLNEDNSLKLESLVGESAEVYLTIPESMKSTGKILVSIKGSTRELEAMTKGEKITTNSRVKIVEIENEIVIVENF